MNYPSVTQVLSRYSDYDSIPESILNRAAERGTAVHSYCAGIIQNEWMPPIPNEYRGYIQSFRRWFEQYAQETYLVEEELVDSDLGYMGHPDWLVLAPKMNGVILIDFKTPASLKKQTWACQTAAYEGLIKKAGKYPPVDRVGTLRLHADGRIARFDDFTENLSIYYGIFVSILTIDKFFQK